MIDGHIHITEELLPYLQNVNCLANADCPEEYAYLKSAGFPVISAGIHPWKAHVTFWEDMEPILQEVCVIGEIGLDGVWCSVDMEIQRSVFRRQLELAARLDKPVVLHTKAMEREVLDTIVQIPNRYLVHWYSHEAYLEDYIALGCWFTVGPDLSDPAVETVARAVPLEKLLIESDGVEAIGWVRNRDVTAAEYPAEMEQHLRAVAALRGMDPAELLRQMEKNLKDFLA